LSCNKLLIEKKEQIAEEFRPEKVEFVREQKNTPKGKTKIGSSIK
jgi:hypothetical protein